MKAISLYLLLLTFSTAQGKSADVPLTEPEKIVSITQKLYEMAYYDEQVDLWSQELSKNKQSANAWMNYYLACRVVNTLTKDQNPYELDKIYADIEKHIEGTYEYHYLTYLNGKGDTALFPHLEKAFALDPDRTEVLSHLVTYYAIKGNNERMTIYNKLWMESGEISSGILNWNYNALIGLDKDAILLTYGDNDTYPSWMLQQVQDVRTDVKVVNIHLLRDREYLDQVFADCGVPQFPVVEGQEQVWTIDLLPVVDHIFYHSARPVYVNVTLPKLLRDNYKDVLYTVGLAFKYSATSFDNVAVLKNNYENKFLTDYLRIGFSFDKSVTVLNSLNVNYLPAFISLYTHYLKGEETVKANNIKEVIENIGEASGRGEEVTALLEKPRNLNRQFESHIDIKKLDKKLKAITNKLYVGETEVTNEFYGQFLMDLLKEKEFDLLEKCKSDKVDWMSLMPDNLRHLTQQQVYNNGSPDSPVSPVANISYAAAEAYCEWLTIVYNNYSKKKKFQEVRFRLPTEEEWEYAARGKLNQAQRELKRKKQAPYPWGGWYFRNSKGCYLSNYYSHNYDHCVDCNPKAKTPDKDGAFFLVNAGSYFPNSYGLYGMSGNAAEMVQGGKIAKGGSWEDIPEECTIQSVKTVSGPSPAIGFRIFMDVIR